MWRDNVVDEDWHENQPNRPSTYDGDILKLNKSDKTSDLD